MKGSIMLKKTFVAVAVAAALGSGLAQAQQPPAAAASPHTITGNVGLFSQYIFRGLTQTNREVAIQGGFDYSHSSGIYAGTWASNISWLRDNGSYNAGGSAEVDFYGGYKWGFAPDFTLDLGTLYYWYPGDTVPAIGVTKADAWEIYAGLSWKWLSAKYSYAIANKNFQFADSSGSWYLDLSANVPLGEFMKGLEGITFMAHWGKQEFKGTTVFAGGPFANDTCSYKDWKLGLSYALPKDFTVGAFYTDTSGASNTCYGNFAEGGPFGFGHNIAKGTGTVYIQKTF
jgi:uncharacterized protein (TIGR02001 family)